ncbi:MAG: class 1 fructose-bisphosphatase [Verrucomicrobia bacterium]|nr:MAG: class 1 fructose-bisphosphatase [Verrucomicrobiota bacterium]
MTDQPFITTVERHFLDRKGRNPHATAEFSWLLSGITLAAKIIAAQIHRAGLVDIIGRTGRTNVQGEEVQKLDEFANDTLVRCLGYRDNVGLLVSEEEDEPHVIKERGESGKYIVLFDPLDGSSNINANVSIGTIFSILARDPKVDRNDVLAHVLQPGCKQVAAGYVVYGSSTVLAYTAGAGVHMFTLDPSIGAFVLAQENIRMPEAAKIYSVNEAYEETFPENFRRYLRWAKSADGGGYSMRYIGSLVADFHRTLISGGVFLYPSTKKSPEGKLRLLYEANPLAFVAEQAGGLASDGRQRILDKKPTAMHQRTPLVIGSKQEVERVLRA